MHFTKDDALVLMRGENCQPVDMASRCCHQLRRKIFLLTFTTTQKPMNHDTYAKQVLEEHSQNYSRAGALFASASASVAIWSACECAYTTNASSNPRTICTRIEDTEERHDRKQPADSTPATHTHDRVSTRSTLEYIIQPSRTRCLLVAYELSTIYTPHRAANNK
jgi:hypothetical protein